MPDATLTLSEHELYFLPPGTPATAPATRVEVEIDGEMRVFLARLIWVERKQYMILYREEKSEEVSLSSGRISGEVPTSNSNDEVDFLINNLPPMPALRLWRASSKEYGLLVDKIGCVYVVTEAQNVRAKRVTFRTETSWNADKFNFYPQNKFVRFCQQMNDDVNSVLHQALIWFKLSAEQKDALAFKCEYGDWDDLQHYLLLVAKIITHQCGPFPLPIVSVSQWKFDLPWPTEDVSVALLWSSHWRATLCHIFQPSFGQSEPAFIMAWRRTQNSRCVVQCTPPTAHEALEAQLELRAFLRPHLPADEIEALFAP